MEIVESDINSVTGKKKLVTYDNVKQKRTRWNRNKSAQTMAESGMTVSKVLLCVTWDR